MVLILPGRKEQQTTTAQKFIDAFGSGLDAVSTHMQQKQKKENMQAAATKLGVDPSILELPEDAQKAYFQQKFAGGPKPLNALQEEQRKAAMAKQEYYKQNQDLFSNLMGGQQQAPQDFQNQIMQEPQEDQGIFGEGIMQPGRDRLEKPQPKGKSNSQPKTNLNDPTTWPDAMISKVRAFKGQPGVQGTMGNMADIEAERRKNVHKETREDKKNETKEKKELNEKIVPLQSALERVQLMKNIREKGNLGRGSSVVGYFGGETSKDRGEYQTLGNSLIAFASTIPVRNRIEFEMLTGKINDPDITDAEAEGVLNSMQRIISDSLKEYQGMESKGSKSQESGKKTPLGDIWK